MRWRMPLLLRYAFCPWCLSFCCLSSSADNQSGKADSTVFELSVEQLLVIHGNLKQNRDNKILHLNYNPGQAILHRCKLARLYSKQGKYSLHDVNLHCRVLFYRTLEVYTKFEIILERIILAPLKHWTFYAFKPFCCSNILLVDCIVLFSCFFIWYIFH